MAELAPLPEGALRVAAWLHQRGHAHAPVLLDGAARTAQQAADGLGVALTGAPVADVVEALVTP